MKTRPKRKKSGIRAGWFVWLVLASVLSAAPQTTQKGKGSGEKTGINATRTIEGRVLTAEGAGIPGAVVLLKDNKTLQVRSYIAQADGAYHFFGLSTEVNYTLRAENQDLTSKQKTVSVFDSHREVQLNLKLTQKKETPKK